MAKLIAFIVLIICAVVGYDAVNAGNMFLTLGCGVFGLVAICALKA